MTIGRSGVLMLMLMPVMCFHLASPLCFTPPGVPALLFHEKKNDTLLISHASHQKWARSRCPLRHLHPLFWRARPQRAPANAPPAPAPSPREIRPGLFTDVDGSSQRIDDNTIMSCCVSSCAMYVVIAHTRRSPHVKCLG
ncbi:hypothetical protein BU24DRAFT_37756 [Aaosphaeria arxii CBS 175.79]|uniref:Secreted protein n=1 Tax=Aaosphaeria arxii CBS 175.79 TaxID=1450172 RepID=A0A6A5Y9V5_9PLEO|nr:uncharacterized protein BU24DRAFT_37756 [Aaosphaeria arxii CBS 175.79]KAF2022119.1 hypothetical protein BU24DRAFT_37756 [Aaosphaeria arxii CBS 175.79]